MPMLKQLFEHYAKVKEWSKSVSKVFFLDLMTFLMQINARTFFFLNKNLYAQP